MNYNHLTTIINNLSNYGKDYEKKDVTHLC
jgi:hypothetical protein